MKLSLLIQWRIFCLLIILPLSGFSRMNSRLEDSMQVRQQKFVMLGGEPQYVEINGASKDNPVLLFLHGGPGWPQTPHLRYFNAALWQHMTVVAWEESGCGKSYMNHPAPEKLNLEQIVKDAHELTQMLKKQFGKQKIYLAGFSWGSIPGLMLAAKYPEDYAAYFGITQVIDLNKSIAISRQWIRKQARTQNDTVTLKILAQLDRGDTAICIRPIDCFLTQYGLLNKYGGALYSSEGEKAIAKAEIYYSDYQKYDWYKAFLYSAYRLEKDLFHTDLSYINQLKIPVYFIMGRHDWNLPTSITVAFAKKLAAPKKELIWLEHSGHEPSSEEPDRFNQIMIERVK
jgi:proline iminopeptidase